MKNRIAAALALIVLIGSLAHAGSVHGKFSIKESLRPSKMTCGAQGCL
jgi:hypothetical protein